MAVSRVMHDDAIPWKQFQHFWPFTMETIDRRWFPSQGTSDAELWFPIIAIAF